MNSFSSELQDLQSGRRSKLALSKNPLLILAEIVLFIYRGKS
ncbi:hypothetical protein [Spirosoma profusum]|nr:hypothetical protein [Spirosoma profusum]